MFYIYLDFGHDKNIIEWVPFPDKKNSFSIPKNVTDKSAFCADMF